MAGQFKNLPASFLNVQNVSGDIDNHQRWLAMSIGWVGNALQIRPCFLGSQRERASSAS